VIMGDEPALEPEVKYYQRLLARDPDEASEIVDAFVNEHSIDEVYDGMLVPALSARRADARHSRLTDDDVRFVLDATRDVVASLARTRSARRCSKRATISPVCCRCSVKIAPRSRPGRRDHATPVDDTRGLRLPHRGRAHAHRHGRRAAVRRLDDAGTQPDIRR